MSYIFMDESGDLGFDFSKKKTTKFFIVTFVFTNNKRPVEKIIRNIFRNFTPVQRKRRKRIIHCTKEDRVVRQIIFNQIQNVDIKLISIILNKQKVYTRLKNEKHVLYNYVTNILLDRIFSKGIIPGGKTINLIASKRETNKFFNQNFKSYLEQQANKIHNVRLEIDIKTPHEEKGLQVADCISWAIFRKYEFKDRTYYDFIRGKIAEENILFH
jgi:hypothetical protein